MKEMQQNLQEKEFLLKQLCRRQEERDRQALQGLQQAMNALLLVQQQLTADLKFHQNLRQSQDFAQLKNTTLPDGSAAENYGQLPPWIFSQPPELQ
ncbi:MAG TPA: hypothetical protein VFC74_01440 [Oscillospiraceae bacterium]|nr:hypothetical protein [Oscillospiraceae bacterium]